MANHLSPEQLLRSLDGELSNSAARKTNEHLRTCSRCALELDRLKDCLATIREAQLEIYEPSLPSPPNSWPRLEPRLDAMANTARMPLWKRLFGFVGGTLRPPFAYAGTALTLLLITLLIWGPIAPLSAKEVIQRVAAADGERLAITPQEVVRQQVRVTKTKDLASGKHTARLESWKSTRSTYWKYSNDPVSAELFDRYKANGLASALPLSPVALESWIKLTGSEPSASREKEKIKVQAISNGNARAHGLEAISFEVEQRGWHVDDLTLAFDDGTFQVQEEESSVLSRAEVPPDVLAILEPREIENAARPALPSGPRRVVPTVNLDALEMTVRYDLHRIGADLGANIEIVKRPPSEIAVNAAGASPQVKGQLAALLANKPGVVLEFQRPVNGSNSGPATRIVTIPQSAARQRDERLLNYFGDAQAEENYSRSVLESSTNVLAPLYALRDLAVRWSPEEEARLSPDSKVQLAAMVRDHARSAQAAVSQLKTQLDSLLKGLGYQALGEVPVSGVAMNWQNATGSSLDPARSVDHILRSLLTTSATPMSLDDAVPRLQQSLRDLQQSVDELPASAR